MAKQIVILCDNHTRRGEDASGSSLRIAVNGSEVEVDLCDECRAEIVAPLEAFLAEYGQPIKDAAPTKPYECPTCHRTYKSPTGLRGHIKDKHPETSVTVSAVGGPAPVATEVPADTPHVCPTCGKKFGTPQGVGAHRSRAHGYRAPAAGNRNGQRRAVKKTADVA